jgi:hypothetical protein
MYEFFNIQIIDSSLLSSFALLPCSHEKRSSNIAFHEYGVHDIFLEYLSEHVSTETMIMILQQ